MKAVAVSSESCVLSICPHKLSIRLSLAPKRLLFVSTIQESKKSIVIRGVTIVRGNRGLCLLNSELDGRAFFLGQARPSKIEESNS